MPSTRPAVVLRQLAAASESTADLDLLRAFRTSRSEPAFAELVRRHGPMVLATCHRVLGHDHDAEDAFQAAFLVLARKAATVRGENVAGWLYGVALRTARGVRLMRSRSRKRELAAVVSKRHELVANEQRLTDVSRVPELAELSAVLDEELARLPDHYRLAVVLCELEGRSRRDAANELGIPEGTLSSRLAAARKMLAERLAHHGVAATAGLLATLFARTATARLPDGLAENTARAAIAVVTGKLTAGLVSPLAAEAVRQGMKATFAVKLRAVMVVAAMAGVGLAGWSAGPGAGGTAAVLAAAPPSPGEPRSVEATMPPEPPEKGAKFWPHFVEVVGDDKSSRALFDLIVSSQPSVVLLERIAEANNPDPPLAHWYFSQMDELCRASRKPSDKVPGAFRNVPVPTADVAGWLLLGTYPGTRTQCTNEVSLTFLNGPGSESFAEALADKSPISKPLRKLLGAWLANRTDDLPAYYDGLPLALRYDVPGALSTARRVLKLYAEVSWERERRFKSGHARIVALLVIGERGSKDDLPLLEECFEDKAIGLYARPGNVAEEKSDTVQVRDVAVGVAIHLCGGKPREFGLPGRVDPDHRRTDRFTPWDVSGFAGDDEREPVHKAALAWLDRHKGPPHGPIRTFAAPAGVGALAFNPKSGQLLVGAADLSVQVWNPTTGKSVSTFRVGAEGSVDTFSGLEVSPDGKRIAARYFVADETGKFLFGLEGHVAAITRMRYDREGKRILTSSNDGTLRIWEADTGKSLRTIEAHMGRKVAPGPQNGFGPRPGTVPERFEGRGARDAAFSPDGKRIVSGGVDGAIRVWDADTGKEIWGGQVSQSLMTVAYLPNGTFVASGEQEGTIRFWDANSGKEVRKLTGHTSAVTCLAVTPDGKQLVSSASDNTVRVWDVESGRELRCFRGHTSWVYAVAVSPDGRTAASGGEDRIVRLWQLP